MKDCLSAFKDLKPGLCRSFHDSAWFCLLFVLSGLMSWPATAVKISLGENSPTCQSTTILIEESKPCASLPPASRCNALITPVTGNSCTATLEVVSYDLKMTNKGVSAMEFHLTSFSVHSSVTNPDNTSASSNIDLLSEIQDMDGKPITKINLQSGLEMNFKLLVKIPGNCRKGVWNSTLIKAVPEECQELEFTLPLFTYIPDPQKDVLGYFDTAGPVSISQSCPPELAYNCGSNNVNGK